MCQTLLHKMIKLLWASLLKISTHQSDISTNRLVIVIKSRYKTDLPVKQSYYLPILLLIEIQPTWIFTSKLDPHTWRAERLDSYNLSNPVVAQSMQAASLTFLDNFSLKITKTAQPCCEELQAQRTAQLSSILARRHVRYYQSWALPRVIPTLP